MQNHLNATLQQQGLPPPPPTVASQQQQHARLSQQQQQQQQQFTQAQAQAQRQHHAYPAASPHQSQSVSTSQSQFIPSQPLQPQYAAQPPSSLLHQPGDPGFFNPHPSPYSTNSAAGSFTSTDATEAMAQATMSRQVYPPITSLQTPQSQSPASMHSPHHDASGRSIYGYPPMGGPMYYPTSYQMHPGSSYGPQAPSASHSYPPVSSSMMMHQHTQHQAYAPQSQISTQSPVDIKPLQPPLQRPSTAIALPPPPTPQSQVQTATQHSTPQTPQSSSMQGLTLGSSTGTSSTAAPGPIPATTPLVVRQDQSGVQWILFEYSRDRVKMEYTIRCDVESVKPEELTQEFKSANCVYPRACGGKETYKGNRLNYETECNTVGWALAQLNPCLREKRGLIQRAVDSWRNSNRDPRLRSRRVRRQAKVQTRKQQAQGSQQMAGSSGNVSMQAPQVPPSRSGTMMQHMPQTHHHGDLQDHRVVDVSESQYHSNNAPQQHGMHSGPALASPIAARYTQQFYPQYPQQPVTGSSQMPSIHDSMNSMMHPPSTTLAAPVPASTQDEDEDGTRALFGNLPDSKRRKFILVEDGQRGGRVRVRVMLDQVKMDDMPDAHLRVNAVYPRSYYPRHMRSPTGSPRSRGIWDDDDDSIEDDRRGKTFVPVKTVDGSEIDLPVPRLTRARRSNEVALNELGYRMSWGQARTFNGRRLFLQRALDAYRSKVRHSVSSSNATPTAIAPHFEVRPGRRKLLERGKRERRDSHAS